MERHGPGAKQLRCMILKRILIFNVRRQARLLETLIFRVRRVSDGLSDVVFYCQTLILEKEKLIYIIFLF